MNILFVCPYPIIPSKGGIQRVTFVLANALKEQGHGVFFLCTRDKYLVDENNSNLPQFYINKNLPEFEFRQKFTEILTNNEIHISIFQYVIDEIKILLRFTPNSVKKITTIHQQPFAGDGFERKIALYSSPKTLRNKISRIICVIFPYVHRAIHRRAERNNINYIYNNSDKVCLLSKHFVSRIKEFMPNIQTGKFCAISNPLTIDNINTSNIKNKENIVLFVGRMENATKNVNEFLNVWNLFSKDNPEWRAIVIGDGPDFFKIKKLSIKMNLQRISFMGHCDDVEQYYKKAKFICVTSFGEGFSLVLLEGINNKCIPFVFNTYEALNDIVEDGKNGFIFTPFDSLSMSKKMTEIAQKESIMESLANESLVSASKFKLSSIVCQWIELMENM